MKSQNAKDQERLAALRLARTAHIGPVTFRQLLARFGSASVALERVPELAQRGGRKAPFAVASAAAAEDELNALAKLKGRLLCLGDDDYPAALAAIDDAPPVLSMIGHSVLMRRDQIAIVGARNASINGRKMAEKLARDLGLEGFVITSGLARGIDAAAHNAALQSGTVAVVAGGLDVVYPEENKKLYDMICEVGCVVAEYPLGTQPQARLFSRRNRVIAGLSRGVVVVEAAMKSGSLITASMALDYGRELFAVPGSPLDPRAAGANSLIAQGATLTQSAQDIVSHISRFSSHMAERPSPLVRAPLIEVHEGDLAAARGKILENIGPYPIEVDEIVRQCHLSLPVVQTVLLEWELAGRLERQPGNKVALIVQEE